MYLRESLLKKVAGKKNTKLTQHHKEAENLSRKGKKKNGDAWVMLEDTLVPLAAGPDAAELLRREDGVLQKQRWERSSYGDERKAGPKASSTAAS